MKQRIWNSFCEYSTGVCVCACVCVCVGGCVGVGVGVFGEYRSVLYPGLGSQGSFSGIIRPLHALQVY